MPRSSFGLIGPTAKGSPLVGNSERTVNWYREAIESPSGATKTNYMLMPTPGLRLFASIAGVTAIQAEHRTPNGRAFAIAGDRLYEVFANGDVADCGGLQPGAGYRLCDSPKQLLIVNGADGWIFDLTAPKLTQITADGWVGGTECAWLDGYFLVLKPSSQQFSISALGNGLQWDALDFGSAEGAPGNALAMKVLHLDIFIFAGDHGEVFYNSGNADLPIVRRQGAVLEEGIAARKTLANFDNTLVWVGANASGHGIVWRANGYTPLRISTHALEREMASYGDISDALGYPFRWNGHSFYRLDFPAARGGLGATWLYDAATADWIEWCSWDASTGQYIGHIGRTHMYAFGLHLVGDYRSGNIYALDDAVMKDNGATIRRERIAPHITALLNPVFYNEACFDVSVGQGLDGDPAPGTDPVLLLSWSNDGGRTWLPEISLSLGKMGAYKTRVVCRRLGRARDRVFRIVLTDPIPLVIANAYVDFDAG